jgi:hypothetical protein
MPLDRGGISRYCSSAVLISSSCAEILEPGQRAVAVPVAYYSRMDFAVRLDESQDDRYPPRLSGQPEYQDE